MGEQAQSGAVREQHGAETDGGRLDQAPTWAAVAAAADDWQAALAPPGDGYLEWVRDRYYWDLEAARTVADTRSLWERRRRYRRKEG